MVTIKYELGKANAKGGSPIYILLSKDRKLKRIRFYVDASPSDISRGVITNSRLEIAVQDKILEYRHKLLDAGTDIMGWDAEKVYQYLTTEEKKQQHEEFKLDFIAFGREHIDRLKKEGREKTAEGYNCAIKSFCRFLETDSIDINSITKNMLLRYKAWAEENKMGARAFELYMSNLQSLHNRAKQYYNDEDDEHLNIRLSPFKSVDFKRSAVEKRDIEKRALSPNAIRYLYELPCEVLSARALLARDAFLLSFALCGMNAIDMLQHKQDEDCAEDYIEYYRAKTVGRTGKEAYIRMHIHPKFIDIHRRLRGKRHTWCFAERYSTSNNLNAGLNIGIKEAVAEAVVYYGDKWGMAEKKAILKRLELPQDLTFYAARHSFATIAANECHVPTETIDRCLCHVVNSVASQSYIKRDYRFTDETINAVVDVVFGK